MSGFAVVEEKTGFDESATYQNLDILCLKPTAKAVYNLTLGDAKLGKLGYSLAYPTASSDIYTGDATLTLSANQTVFFQVKTTAEEGATIKAEKAKAALEGKNYVEKDFNGTIVGKGSYWHMFIDSFGTTDGEGAFRNNGITVTELSSENGVTTLQFHQAGTLTKGYTDGHFMYAYANGEEWFASSSAAYSSAIAGQWAKTSDYVAGGETGVEILSIMEGSTRVYCAVIAGKVYLGATVEFTSGNSIGTADAVFSVKDASGNVLGSYKVTAACSSYSVGTIVAA